LEEHQVYDAIGEAGFARLTAAFYKQVPGDEILGPMYPLHDLTGAEERLKDFLVGRFGGPPRYIEQRGHPRLRMRHMPFPIDPVARNRWMTLMTKALGQAQLDTEAAAIL
jgi:hemoglobin